MVIDDKCASFIGNKEEWMRKVAKERAVLELNIPPLPDYCMSP